MRPESGRINTEEHPGDSSAHTTNQYLNRCYRLKFMQEIWWRTERERACSFENSCSFFCRWVCRTDSGFFWCVCVCVSLLKDHRMYDVKPWAIRWCLSGLALPPVCRARIRDYGVWCRGGRCVWMCKSHWEMQSTRGNLYRANGSRGAFVLHFGRLVSVCVMGCALWSAEEDLTTMEQQQ